MEADQKKAKKKKATIVFIDESGILMSPVVRRTWAPVGQTPKIAHRTRSHKKISAFGAIAVRHSGRKPRLMFRLLEGKNMNSELCIQFLAQLKQNIKGHVIVVWDRLLAHRSRKVNRWLSRQSRLEAFLLPPYAPELNPVEYLWSYLKTNPMANYAAQGLEDLYWESKSAICGIRKEKDLISSFILHSPIGRTLMKPVR